VDLTPRHQRLSVFIRSILPADPSQLLFLIGIVCLIFAPRLNWWPVHLNESLSRRGIDNRQVGRDAMPYMVLAEFTFIFSALAGYYSCFRPSLRPIRRVFLLTILPALVALVIAVGRFALVGSFFSSILDRNFLGISGNPVQWIGWASTPGFHLALLGLLLIGVFASRMMFGIASLPLALHEASIVKPTDPQLWMRMQFLIWVLVGPLFLIAILPGIALIGIARGISPQSSDFVFSSWFIWLSPAVETLTHLVVACWIAGKVGGAAIKSSIRLSQPKYLFLAIGFSIGIALSISIGQYFVDRSMWAEFHFGDFAPPQLRTYFDFPNPWRLFMFFGALFEEIIFRGILQTVFVRRYGLYRGIFLVATVWAAYHFNFDATSHPNEVGVLFQLAYRLFMCVSLSFVLGWLTLRSESIIPAAFAHAIFNMTVSAFGPSFPWKQYLPSGIWALLACILFRYWPVQLVDEIEPQLASPEAEPAA
jgi:membrane protease YdiL (CAAX protease family)